MGLDTDIVLSFASCYISISAMRLMFYCMYGTHSDILTNTEVYICNLKLFNELAITTWSGR